MSYIGKMEAGHSLTGLGDDRPVGMHKTWTARVYWKREKDGGEEVAYHSGSIFQGDAKAKARLQARLDRDVANLVAFAKHRGYRWEVKRREKAERKRAKAIAERRARERVLQAAPDLLAACKAMLAAAASEYPGPRANACDLARVAILKAEG